MSSETVMAPATSSSGGGGGGGGGEAAILLIPIGIGVVAAVAAVAVVAGTAYVVTKATIKGSSLAAKEINAYLEKKRNQAEKERKRQEEVREAKEKYQRQIEETLLKEVERQEKIVEELRKTIKLGSSKPRAPGPKADPGIETGKKQVEELLRLISNLPPDFSIKSGFDVEKKRQILRKHQENLRRKISVSLQDLEELGKGLQSKLATFIQDKTQAREKLEEDVRKMEFYLNLPASWAQQKKLRELLLQAENAMDKNVEKIQEEWNDLERAIDVYQNIFSFRKTLAQTLEIKLESRGYKIATKFQEEDVMEPDFGAIFKMPDGEFLCVTIDEKGQLHFEMEHDPDSEDVEFSTLEEFEKFSRQEKKFCDIEINAIRKQLNDFGFQYEVKSESKITSEFKIETEKIEDAGEITKVVKDSKVLQPSKEKKKAKERRIQKLKKKAREIKI